MDICALNFQLLGSVYIFFSLTLSASGYDSFVYIYICFNIHRYIHIYVKYNLLDYYNNETKNKNIKECLSGPGFTVNCKNCAILVIHIIQTFSQIYLSISNKGTVELKVTFHLHHGMSDLQRYLI